MLYRVKFLEQELVWEGRRMSRQQCTPHLREIPDDQLATTHNFNIIVTDYSTYHHVHFSKLEL